MYTITPQYNDTNFRTIHERWANILNTILVRA